MVYQYEELTTLGAHFQPLMKKAMLQNFHKDLSPFSDVKTAEDLEVTKGITVIDYEAYIIIVQQVAENRDNRHQFRK